MRRAVAVVLSAAVLALAAGCASTRQYVPLPDQSVRVANPEMARIYVMRPSNMGSAVPMAVRDGDKLVGSTGPKGYLCWEREPGKVSVSSKAENTDILDLELQKGDVCYLLQYVHWGFLVARTSLEKVDESRGQSTLAGCHEPIVQTP